MARYFLIIISIILFFSFCSCGFREPIIEVLDGNYRYLRGDFTGATISYIKALENGTMETWIHYNLGNVFNALGETEAAVEELNIASHAKNRELLFRSQFNLGNISFRLGKYKDAVEYYKKAVKAKSNNLDAKINLELAVKKMEKEEALNQISNSEKPEKKQIVNTEKTENLLNYVKQKEAAVWRSINHASSKEQEEDW